MVHLLAMHIPCVTENAVRGTTAFEVKALPVHWSRNRSQYPRLFFAYLDVNLTSVPFDNLRNGTAR